MCNFPGLFIMCNLVSHMSFVSYHCGHAHLIASPPWPRAPRCHIIIVMRTWLPHYRGHAHFVVLLLRLYALCCHIIIAVHILYIVSIRLIDTILSVL